MNAYEWIFREERDLRGYGYGMFTYYTVEPDGQMVILHIRDWIVERCKEISENDFIHWLAVCLGINDDDLFDSVLFSEECAFIEYTQLDFLKSINIEGDITCFREPCQRNQLVGVRGTCSQECPDCIPEFSGYALRDLPICDKEKNLLGTTLWTAKWATIFDMLRDVFFWVRYCRCLDVLIYNFDFTPYGDDIDLHYDSCVFAAYIQGNTIRFIESASERKKLFKKYSKTYECVDYKLEDVIREGCDCRAFLFDKPVKRQN